MKQNPENNRWLYESLVPDTITDPEEREAYIRQLMEGGVAPTAQQKEGERLEYFTD